MRVSIMSMQRIANYGSFLQAYALKKTIETLGHQVDFADYRVQPCLIQPQKVEQGKDTYIKDKAFRLMNAIKCFAYKIPLININSSIRITLVNIFKLLVCLMNEENALIQMS